MIEYNIKDPSFFLRSLSSIAKVADETVLQFGGRLRTYGMDASSICLYELVIGKSELEIIKDGKIDAMFHLDDLQKIINRFKNPEVLTIQYNDNILTIKGIVNDKKKTFTLSELDSEIPIEPMVAMGKLALDSVFVINLADLLEMIKDMEIYAEIFTIETVDDKMIIKASGVIGNAESEIDIDDGVTSNEKCSYSLTYAKGILGTLGSQDVTISFAKNMPIMIFDKLSKDSFIRWYLAPRVEQDE